MATVDAKPSAPAIHPCVIELREMLQSVLGDDFVRLYHYGSRVTGGAAPTRITTCFASRSDR